MTTKSSAELSASSSLLDCHCWPKTIGLVVFATALTVIAGMMFQRDNALAEVDALQKNIAQLTHDNSLLAQQRISLLMSSHQQQTLLADRDEELAEQRNIIHTLKERMDSVEIAMGIQETEAVESLEHRVDTAAINTAVRATMLRLIPNGQPIESFRRSSGYGRRVHPVTGDVRNHLGLDLTADIGTPVYAPADGVVELVRPSNKGYGNMVKIQHAFGFGTIYAHLDKFIVRNGEFVNKGQLIAWSGNTGLSTGPHLHYEVRFLGRALNPSSFINWAPDDFDSLFEKEKSIAWSNMVDVIAQAMTLPVQLTQGRDGAPALAVNAELLEHKDEG